MQTSPSTARTQHLRRGLAWTTFAIVWSWAWAPPVLGAAAPTLPISQTPMTVTIPAHPQILLAVGNSQSMDGNLSGAIMTGSGSLPASLALLQNSSSPVNFTIPAGFTPPLNTGNGIVAPYTVSSGGHLVDNSPSRLNVAKGGITQILNTYIASADFGLLDYRTGGPGLYSTYVYQMSQPGGFTFTNVAGVNVPGTVEYIPNPCFGVLSTGVDPVSVDCHALHAYYLGTTGQDIYGQQYLVIGASSDDPQINDVLYAGGEPPVCIVYGGPNPPTPFPPYYSLGNYNGGGVFEGYSTGLPGGCATGTGPTNAGYVPYSTQVMYEQRGWAYYTGQSPNTGNLLVPMTSAGATPTPASVAAALANFTPYLAPETNSSGTGEMKATAVQSPTAGLIAKAKAYFATHPPTSNGCAAQQYVVLVTDGLPTQDLSGRLWPPAGSAAAIGYGMTANFLSDGSLDTANTNDQALLDVVTNLQNLAAAGVKTYIIGVGAGVDPTVNPVAASTMTAMAIAGGTGTASPTGYFAANSPQQVTDDLQIIITKILAATQSVASAAVNSTGLNTTSVVYQSQFLTSDTYQDWDGNLFAFPIAADGTVNTFATPLWSAAAQLELQDWDAGRVIATWDPTLNAGIPFRWNPTPGANGINPGTTLGQDLTTFTADTNGQDVLNYLRGSYAQDQNNGGQFRKRTHRLGDIVNSDPLYIGAPSAANQTPSYVAFAAANAARRPVLYVGANDGMLHAFDATSIQSAAPFNGSTTGGNELFAYIPRGVYGNLINLVNPYYNAVHQYFVNGSPQASDIQFADASWHTVLVGTEGAGGTSVYALDVTNPASITSEGALASAVLWDFIDPDMGLGFSTPAIASTPVGWTVFVGNGYNSPTQKPFLFALNAQTGATVSKIDLCAAVPTACNLTASNGLSTVIAVNSGGQLAGFANIVYAGDLQGNLWRVDVSNPNPAMWTATVMFQARDPLGNSAAHHDLACGQPQSALPAGSWNHGVLRHRRVIGRPRPRCCQCADDLRDLRSACNLRNPSHVPCAANRGRHPHSADALSAHVQWAGGGRHRQCGDDTDEQGMVRRSHAQ